MDFSPVTASTSIKFHLNEWKVTVNRNEIKTFEIYFGFTKGMNDNYIFYDLITVYNRRKIKILSLKILSLSF